MLISCIARRMLSIARTTSEHIAFNQIEYENLTHLNQSLVFLLNMTDQGGLEEQRSSVEHYEQLNKGLAAKLEISKELIAKEKSAHLLIQFELSQIKEEINQSKKENYDLEKELTRLITDSRDANHLVKRIRCLHHTNTIQVNRKAEWHQDLVSELHHLDFTIEEQNMEPDRSVDTFTQNILRR